MQSPSSELELSDDDANVSFANYPTSQESQDSSNLYVLYSPIAIECFTYFHNYSRIYDILDQIHLNNSLLLHLFLLKSNQVTWFLSLLFCYCFQHACFVQEQLKKSTL